MTSNLHTRGNGLCGTFVEWDDIERSIQRETNRKMFLGPHKTARQVGDGQGATSCIAVVDPDAQGDSEGLPSRFAVKMASSVGAAQIINLVGHGLGPDVDVESACLAYDEIAREGHNREINVYRMFNDCYREISKMPRFFFGTEFSKDNKMKGIIGMELIEDTESLHIFHNLKPHELSDVLRAIAYLEAKSLTLSDENKQKLRKNPIPALYRTIMDPEAISNWLQEISAESDLLKPFVEELVEMTEELFVPELTSTLSDELSSVRLPCINKFAADMKEVFVHGDLWALNLMWTKTKNGLKLRKIIDYQFAHFGCAAEDLARLLITTLSGKDRRENWERLLEEFHSYLMQYCIEELPFTLLQLKESYRRIFPLAGLFLIEVFNFVPKMVGKELSNDEQKAMRKIILEKTAALLEDMLQFARRNQNLPKNYR